MADVNFSLSEIKEFINNMHNVNNEISSKKNDVESAVSTLRNLVEEIAGIVSR